MNSIIDAAARPTRTNTPATAPLFWKKDEVPPEPLSELRVGLTPICVIVTTPPSVPVLVTRLVTADGALVVVWPALFVVVMNTVLCKVVTVWTRAEVVVVSRSLFVDDDDDDVVVSVTVGVDVVVVSDVEVEVDVGVVDVEDSVDDVVVVVEEVDCEVDEVVSDVVVDDDDDVEVEDDDDVDSEVVTDVDVVDACVLLEVDCSEDEVDISVVEVLLVVDGGEVLEEETDVGEAAVEGDAVVETGRFEEVGEVDVMFDAV